MASLAFLCRRYQHVVRPHHAPSSVGVTPFSRSVLRRLRSRQHTNINLSPGVRHRLARLLSACQDLLVPGSDSPRDKDEPFRSSSSLPQLVGVSPLVVAPLVHTRRLHTSAARRVSTRFTSAQLPYRRHVIDDVQEERHGKVPEEHFIAEARSHPTGPVPGDVVSVPEETTSTVKVCHTFAAGGRARSFLRAVFTPFWLSYRMLCRTGGVCWQPPHHDPQVQHVAEDRLLCDVFRGHAHAG